MQLMYNTPAVLFELRTPIWNGGRKVVGLAEERIGKHNEIRFTYRRKSDGELSMPDAYYFDGDLLRKLDFARQNIRGMRLVLIPFTNLERLERIGATPTPPPTAPPLPPTKPEPKENKLL